MTRTVQQYGRKVMADRETPLRLTGLADFLCVSRGSIYGDLRRGYAMEFGDMTTPGHYLDWLRKNPRPRRRQSREREREMEAQLNQLR